MYIFVLIIFLLIIIQLKFSPKIYFVDEGLFLQYTIKGKIGEKETIIKLLCTGEIQEEDDED